MNTLNQRSHALLDQEKQKDWVHLKAVTLSTVIWQLVGGSVCIIRVVILVVLKIYIYN